MNSGHESSAIEEITFAFGKDFWTLFAFSFIFVAITISLVTFGVIARDPAASVLLYMIAAIYSVPGLLFSYRSYLIFHHPQKLRLTESQFEGPRSVWGTMTLSIPYEYIDELKFLDIQEIRTLHLRSQGKDLYLVKESDLKNKTELDNLWSILDAFCIQNDGSLESYERRIPCKFCDRPVTVAYSKQSNGVCFDCFSMTPAEIRQAGIFAVVVGLSIVVACGILATIVGVVLASLQISFVHAVMGVASIGVFGLVYAVKGFYSLITGKPIRNKLSQ